LVVGETRGLGRGQCEWRSLADIVKPSGKTSTKLTDTVTLASVTGARCDSMDRFDRHGRFIHCSAAVKVCGARLCEQSSTAASVSRSAKRRLHG